MEGSQSDVLYTGDYRPSADTSTTSGEDVNTISFSDVTMDGVSVVNASLQISKPDMNTVGYYSIYGNGTEIIHQFVVYSKSISDECN